MERLTVALTSDWFAPRVGGIELQMQDLARELHARGHEVHIVTTTPGPPAFEGIPVHRQQVPMVKGWDVAVPNLLRIPVAVRAIRQVQPDIVHAHGMFSVTAIGTLIAARHLGIPCVSTHHSLLPGGNMWAARAVFAVFSYRADVVSAVSQAAATDARRASGRRRIPVLPNGLHLGQWTRPHHEPPDLHVVSVMRLAKTKQPAALVAAVPGLIAGVPASRGVRVTIVGDGPERANLEQMARDLGVAGHITFAGELSRERVRDMLHSASLFALPCQAEAFGIAVLEARGAGLPVVAMNRGGIPEIVEHGRHGLLANSEQEFADHLVTLASDDPLRHRLAAQARVGIDRFGWDHVVARHLQLYRETIERHHGRRRERRTA